MSYPSRIRSLSPSMVTEWLTANDLRYENNGTSWAVPWAPTSTRAPLVMQISLVGLTAQILSTRAKFRPLQADAEGLLADLSAGWNRWNRWPTATVITDHRGVYIVGDADVDLEAGTFTAQVGYLLGRLTESAFDLAELVAGYVPNGEDPDEEFHRLLGGPPNDQSTAG